MNRMGAGTWAADDWLTMGEANASFAAPLDAAAEYLRSRLPVVLPLYLLAMLPHAAVMWLLIDAVVGERRTQARACCLYLTAATLWRWIGLSFLQHHVQRDLRSSLTPVSLLQLLKKLPVILLLRLFAALAIIWGGLLAGIPAFYGLLLAVFATPLITESDEPTSRRLRGMFQWIRFSHKRLFRVFIAMGLLWLTLIVVWFAAQWILCRSLLPTLLGINTADMQLTINSWAWRLSVLYFIFLGVDLYFTVAGVFLYYDSQSRRLATDLRLRLQRVVGETT